MSFLRNISRWFEQQSKGRETTVIVAVSSVNDFTVKESYNSISTEDVFNTIMNMAFSASNCPNSSDPLILNFRIMIIYNI